MNPLLIAFISVSSLRRLLMLLCLAFKSKPPIHISDAMFNVLNDPTVLPLTRSSVPSSSNRPS